MSSEDIALRALLLAQEALRLAQQAKADAAIKRTVSVDGKRPDEQDKYEDAPDGKQDRLLPVLKSIPFYTFPANIEGGVCRLYITAGFIECGDSTSPTRWPTTGDGDYLDITGTGYVVLKKHKLTQAVTMVNQGSPPNPASDTYWEWMICTVERVDDIAYPVIRCFGNKGAYQTV